MKGALCTSLMVLGALVLFIGVASGQLTCNDGAECEEDECCLKITSLITKCLPMKAEGEKCQLNPLKALFKNDIFKVMCPCKDGLTCVEKEGLLGKLQGTCQEDPNSE